jgi:hypothetical protein
VLHPHLVRPNATTIYIYIYGVTSFVDFISDGYMLFKYMGANR